MADNTQNLGTAQGVTTINDEGVLLTTSKGAVYQIKKADLAEVLRGLMSVATSSKNGLMSATDKANSSTWATLGGSGGSRRCMTIETSLSRPSTTWMSYACYMWLGQGYNTPLFNEVYWINVSYISSKLSSGLVNKLRASTRVYEIVFYFNASDKLCIAVNFSSNVNSANIANEISVRAQNGTNAVKSISFSDDVYVAGSADLVLSIS